MGGLTIQGVQTLTHVVGGLFSGVIDAQAAAAQTQSVFKATGGVAGVTASQVLKLGDAYEQTTKFTSEQTQGAENLLLTFKNIWANVFPQATTAVLDISQAAGTDLKGASIRLIWIVVGSDLGLDLDRDPIAAWRVGRGLGNLSDSSATTTARSSCSACMVEEPNFR